jgi:superfamily I DNA and/or RNA helicase
MSSAGPRSAYNILEVDVIEGVYRYLKRVIPNLNNENIGIIATYRKQVEKLNERFGDEILKGLEISTVDSFQGKEKDIIIFSTVYAPGELKRKSNIGPRIFKDRRRFNVAFTRAKYKLIMVGDIELVRRDVKYFQEAYKHIRDAYRDPNNKYCKRGIVKDPELCEYLRD